MARILLDRIVASGAAGVDRRDTDHWVLSRLIELRYVEESTLADTVFVCTPAGRHRWRIEIVADEERDAFALRRQLIRQRLDKRFSKLGIETSTALVVAYSPAEPRLHSGMPALWSTPPQTKMRWSSALATAFAAAAAALVVISANTEPQEMRDWLFPPRPHVAALPAHQPKADVKQAVLVAAPAVAAPADRHAEQAPRHAVVSADAAAASTQRAASISIIAPSRKKGDDITSQAGQNVSVPKAALAKVDEAGRERSTVVAAAPPDRGAILNSVATAAAPVEAAPPDRGAILNSVATAAAPVEAAPPDRGAILNSVATAAAPVEVAPPDRGAILNSVVTAAAPIDAAVRVDGHIATDLTAAVERGFKSLAAVLLHAFADLRETVSTRGAVIQQVHDDAPAPLAPATEPPSQGEQPATLQPALAPHTETPRAIVHATPGGRATARDPAARGGEADADSQHAVVERLNGLSLAAARRGEAWRPDRLGDVAETGRPL